MIIVINVYDMLEVDTYGKMKSKARNVCSARVVSGGNVKQGVSANFTGKVGLSKDWGSRGAPGDVSPSEEPSKGKE